MSNDNTSNNNNNNNDNNSSNTDSIYEDLPPSYEEATGYSLTNITNPLSDVSNTSETINSTQNEGNQENEDNPITQSLTYHSIPTLTAPSNSDFNPDYDTGILIRAMSYNRKEEILKLLCHRTYAQRMQISRTFYIVTGKYLIKQLKNVLSSHFCKLMCGLTVPYYEFLARTIHNCTHFKWIAYILFTLTSKEIYDMSQYFEIKYRMTIERFIKSKNEFDTEESSYMLKPIFRMLQNTRIELDSINEDEVNRDVLQLCRMKSNSSFYDHNKEDKEILKDILYNKSFNHIKSVCKKYYLKTQGRPINDLIEKLYTYHRADVFNGITHYAVNKNIYFAFILKNSLKEKNYNLLMHVIIRRCEMDLKNISHEFNKKNKCSLKQYIDTHIPSCVFKRGLFELIGETT